VATGIEWTDDTWNPTLGCDRVSKGCDLCYAVRTATVRAGHPHPAIAAAYEGLTHRTEGGSDWTGLVRMLPERLTIPLRWKKPRRIFVDSQSDLFHANVPDEFIAAVWAVMAATPRHTYQILTKRHARARSLLRDDCRCGAGHPAGAHLLSAMSWAATEHNPDHVPGLTPKAVHEGAAGMTFGQPLRNVHLGVSVEDQKAADLRIPALLQTPAVVRWLSCEPLLGPVDLFGYRNGLDWVVAGGESGPSARPLHPEWARQLRDQCQAAGVPYHFKQRGEYTWSATPGMPFEPRVYVSAVDGRVADEQVALADGGRWQGVWKVGKKAAGRELDGREWDERPGTLQEREERVG
jgi:protein gp37